jgi:hypothetical protein
MAPSRPPTSSGLGPSRLPATGLGRAVRRLPLPAIAGRVDPDGLGGRRELAVVVATVAVMAAIVSGPLVAVVAAFLFLATAFATLRLLADVDGPNADGGVPIESLIIPAVAALGGALAIRLVPPGVALVPAVAVVAFIVDRSVGTEARIIAAPQGPADDDRTRTLVMTLVTSVVAFAGVAAVVPGGLAGTALPGAPATAMPLGNLVVLAIADAFIAGLLGYRAVALRVSSARAAIWAAASYAVAIAIGAAAIRAMGIPRLIGPALLMFLFYLWDTLHAAPPSRRRDPRWIWETAILAAAAVAVAAWNLRVSA